MKILRSAGKITEETQGLPGLLSEVVPYAYRAQGLDILIILTRVSVSSEIPG